MGLWGSGKLPGKGHSGKRCDYCRTDISNRDSNNLPNIGNSVLMGHNRYFCSSECMRNWRDQHNYQK
jgi:hypothetical protein